MESNNSITVFTYEDVDIAFKADDGSTMVNATQMAKTFNKRVTKWLELPSTQEFLQTLSEVRKSGITQLVATRRGNFADKREQGTWMHEDVALEFARWLNPLFAIWCNDRIKEIITGRASRRSVSSNNIQQICELQDKIIRLYRDVDNERSRAERLNQEIEEVISVTNAALALIPNLVTTTEIAAHLGMKARTLNDKLEEAGVIERINGGVYLTETYYGKGLAVDCAFCDANDDITNYLKWTNVGQTFLLLLAKHNYNADRVWAIFGSGSKITCSIIK